MKYVLFVFISALLCLQACKKDNADHPNSYFTIKDKTGVTPYGYFYISGPARSVDLWSVPRSPEGYTGEIHYASISIDTLINGAQYTYHAAGAGFDPTQHFSAATVILDGQANGNDPITLNPGTILLQDVNGGKITLNKNGNDYTLQYTLVFGVTQVTGVYKGTLEQY